MSNETEKTIRVDGTVHKRLQELKNEHDVNTFNDALRFELGIVPDPVVEDLAPWFPDEFRTAVEEAVEEIESHGPTDRSVEEVGVETNRLVFTSTNTNDDFAYVDLSEERFEIHYRQVDSSYKRAVFGFHRPREGETKYKQGKSDVSKSEMLNIVRQKTRGSYRAHGTD